MLLLVLLLLDLVPLAGHFVVKPFQLAFPLVYPIHVAVSLLVTFVFTSCMNALMVGRLLLRERVRRWAAGVATFHAMDRAITKHGGLRLVVLFRLTPLPEAVASFLLSVTSVSTLHYAIAAFAEAVKSTLITLYLAFGVREGARAMTRTGGVDWGSLLLLCAGGGMLLLAVWSIRRAVTRELALSRPSSSRSPKGDCAVRGDGDATRIDRLSLASTMLV